MSIDQSSTRPGRCEECGENEPSVHLAYAHHDVRLCADCNDRFWRGEIRADGRYY
ncbi:hypothetical protein ACFQE1_10930 [Halobium palmae]|uniref:Small CPxCG-related zinc finger protein n=1 Tax=Halobium palmae TaxID=1776492 RepID=A0ABD5RZN2_9EURY